MFRRTKRIYEVEAKIKPGMIKLVSDDEEFRGLINLAAERRVNLKVIPVDLSLVVSFDPRSKLSGLGYPVLKCDNVDKVLNFITEVGTDLRHFASAQEEAIILYNRDYRDKSHYY